MRKPIDIELEELDEERGRLSRLIFALKDKIEELYRKQAKIDSTIESRIAYIERAEKE